MLPSRLSRPWLTLSLGLLLGCPPPHPGAAPSPRADGLAAAAPATAVPDVIPALDPPPSLSATPAPSATNVRAAGNVSTDSAALSPSPYEEPAPWWGAPYPKPFDLKRLSHQLPRIHVDGNRFVNEAGSTVIFQGVSIADPDKLIRERHWNRALFEAIASWGANIVRVPVHPAAFRGRGSASYFELLDQAVIWANELGMYVIVDWHSIGNLVTELFQHPMYDTSRQETYQFWRSAAFRYQAVPGVALYEIFNEPTLFNGKLGKASWQQWKSINEEIIDIIYAHNPAAIPLVAGFDWAYDLKPVAKAPIERKGIAYVSHPYPQKAKLPFQPKWEESFGFVAAKYPLITTEIGYMSPEERGAHSPAVDTQSYGTDITDYLAKKGASWVAWCFSPDWGPPLVSDWDYTPTPSGAHFREVMLRHAAQVATGGAAGKAGPLTQETAAKP
jgi:endoglucanase